MIKIAVASHNPVKIEAVRNGFLQMFPCEKLNIDPANVDSGISDQPLSDGAALKGAINRAENARSAVPGCDYWVGVEGGCDYLDGNMVAFAWIVVLSEQMSGQARTALFQLPKSVQTLIEQGLELGDADDRVFGSHNSKQNSGAVGLLTGDVVTRTSLYQQAVILALIPFKNPSLYLDFQTTTF